MRKVSSLMVRRFQRNLMRKVAALDDMEREHLLQISTGAISATQEERDEANRRLMNDLPTPVSGPAPDSNVDMDLEHLKYLANDKTASPALRAKAVQTLRENGVEEIQGVGWTNPPGKIKPGTAQGLIDEEDAAQRKAKIKATLLKYAPWVGGGAGLGALLGGGIGYGVSGKTGGTLLGAGLGALGGAGAGGLGKYLYDRYSKR